MGKKKGDRRRPASAENNTGRDAAQAMLEEFDMTGLLGEGAYGTVHRGLHRATKQHVAIKSIVLQGGEPIQTILEEINTIRDLDSPHIVNYLGSFYVKPALNIVMEFCEAGSCADVMRLRQKTMNEGEIATVLSGTLKGLRYIHEQRYIHRDIKAGNVLLSASCAVKLADFGVAGQLTESTQKRKTVIGSPFWMAPEVIQEVGHDSKADLWSIGILAMEMAQGQPPYATMHPMRAIFKIASGPPAALEDPEQWSTNLRQFLSRCLVKEPKERATAKELLGMKFISESRPAEVELVECVADSIRILNARLASDGTIAPAEDTKHTHVPGGSGPVDASANRSLDGDVVDVPMDLGTMVINEDTGETLKPSFMKHFENEDENSKLGDTPQKTPTGGNTPTLLEQSVDFSDIRKRLETLAQARGKSERRKRRPSST